MAARAFPAALLLPLPVGVLLRLAILPFAEDMWGDAPVRLELARRWAAAPGLWWSYREVFQFGPLPTHLGGALIRLGLEATFGPRLLSLAAGVAALVLVMRIARRLGGTGAALLAGWAVALSPLHLQASTTFASEALFVAFALACLDRALARDLAGCALWAFAASTTRYDAWLWLPVLAVWFVATRYRGVWGRGLFSVGLLFLGPLSIVIANALAGDAMAPMRHVSEEHVELAAGSIARYGEVGWRLRMLVYWPLMVVAVLTPGFALLAMRALGRVRGRGEAALAVVLGAWAPALYLVRTIVFGTFWPMARFVLAPAVLVLTAASPVSRKTLGICIALALAFNVVLVVAPALRLPYAGWLPPISPVSRLPADLRAGAEAIRTAKGDVTLDYGPGYEEIFVAHHAGADRFTLYRNRPGEGPHRIVSFRRGALDGELRSSGQAFGQRYRLAGREGRVSWWDRVE